MEEIQEISEQHRLTLIEDCAEAHGVKYKGKYVGSFGDISCFSFFANKIINTGEGGMVLTSNEKIYTKIKSRSSLSYGETDRFKHDYIGYNYRYDNVRAALGVPN